MLRRRITVGAAAAPKSKPGLEGSGADEHRSCFTNRDGERLLKQTAERAASAVASAQRQIDDRKATWTRRSRRAMMAWA
jgi:hypothetical protein